MKVSIRRCATWLALAASIGLTGAQAADYPCPTIKLVSPYPPGGTTDILARLIQPGLNRALNVPVVVENKAGASSNIGTEFVALAPADGCTLLLGNNTGVVINRNLYRLRQDPTQALAPIGAVASVPLVLYVHPGVQAQTVDQLVELARKQSGQLSYASGGSGSPQHLMGELLKLERHIDIVHIPYKGQGPAMQDVVSGQVPMAFETVSVIAPQVSAGRVRALAVTGASRSKSLPQVPTMKELGYADFVTENWYGVFAPAKTPAPVLQRLDQVLRQVLALPEVRSNLERLGSSEVPQGAEEFARFIAREKPLWESLVKRSGAKVD